MADLNITFEQQPHNGHQDIYAVRCELLPLKHEARIVEQPIAGKPSEWWFSTATTNVFRKRGGRHLRQRHGRLLKSLDAAKAAAVAYVKARVAKALREVPVRYGHGQYRQSEQGSVWYVAFDANPQSGWYPAGTRKQALHLLDNPPEWAQPSADLSAVTVTDGVCRWKSNGNVPPHDCLDALAAAGLVFDRQKTKAVRDEDLRGLFEAARQSPRNDSPEAQFERLAAFGPGQEIVDVLTGHRYRT